MVVRIARTAPTETTKGSRVRFISTSPKAPDPTLPVSRSRALGRMDYDEQQSAVTYHSDKPTGPTAFLLPTSIMTEPPDSILQ